MHVVIKIKIGFASASSAKLLEYFFYKSDRKLLDFLYENKSVFVKSTAQKNLYVGPQIIFFLRTFFS